MSEPPQSTAEPPLRAWEHLRSSSPPELRRWLNTGKPVALHADLMMVAVPNIFTRNQLEVRFRTEIETTLAEFFGRQRASRGAGRRLPRHRRAACRTRPRPEPDPDPSLDGAHPTLVEAPGASGNGSVAPAYPEYDGTNGANGADPYRPRREADVRLNPKYTFETFVIGSSNRFAHAAAIAVAESPGKSYNPLTIYGESGLGKTHLLHALGHYVRSYGDRVRVRYVSTEELTNDFINAISQNKGVEFRRRYRDVDVLLIDDIQFLEGKEQTQEEFFHTFNTLHNAQKQIVMTSDRPPKLLENLEPRLRSRFGWGLITDVQPPDLETRIAILRKKAGQERLVAGPEVLEFIASRIQTNIRELEGALIRVTAFASLNRQPVDLVLAEQVLKDLIPDGAEAQITTAMIQAQTATYFDVTIEDLCGQSRTHTLTGARQIAMYLCRELTDLSLPKIGAQFGGRDHTTVMHAGGQDPQPDGGAAQRVQPGHRADRADRQQASASR